MHELCTENSMQVRVGTDDPEKVACRLPLHGWEGDGLEQLETSNAQF